MGFIFVTLLLAKGTRGYKHRAQVIQYFLSLTKLLCYLSLFPHSRNVARARAFVEEEPGWVALSLHTKATVENRSVKQVKAKILPHLASSNLNPEDDENSS